jgi:hypothetical protein
MFNSHRLSLRTIAPHASCSSGAGPQVSVAAGVVPGRSPECSQTCLRSSAPRALPPTDAPRGSSPPAPRCRLLERPGKRSHLACAKGGREGKRLRPPAAVVRPDPHRACPTRRQGGSTRAHTWPLYVKGCWLHQTSMQPTHWTGASVPRCAAMPAPQSPWHQNHTWHRYARHRRPPARASSRCPQCGWARCQPAWVGRGHKSGQGLAYLRTGLDRRSRERPTHDHPP